MSWDELCREVERRYGGTASEEALLFLVGLNEKGDFPDGDEKLVKLNLIQLGTIVLLARAGYMRLVGRDAEGWPLWERTASLPPWTPAQQRAFLREALIQYFTEIWKL